MGLPPLEAKLGARASAVPADWLREKVTVDQAEAQAIRGENQEWQAIKSGIEAGDEVWLFSSDAESWRHLAGRAGVVVVRDGVQVASMVTMMN
jgi:hypothetical protein